MSPMSVYFSEVIQLPRILEDGSCDIVLCSDNAKSPTSAFRQRGKLVTVPEHASRTVEAKSPRRTENLRRGAAQRRLPILVPPVPKRNKDRWNGCDSDPTSQERIHEVQYGQSRHPLFQGRSVSLSILEEESSLSRWDAERIVVRADSDSVLVRPSRLDRPQRRISPKMIPALRLFARESCDE